MASMRDVAAPRPPLDGAPLRVGDPEVDEVAHARHHVRDLGEPDVAVVDAPSARQRRIRSIRGSSPWRRRHRGRRVLTSMGRRASGSAHSGPPWTYMTVGNGPAPSGAARPSCGSARRSAPRSEYCGAPRRSARSPGTASTVLPPRSRTAARGRRPPRAARSFRPAERPPPRCSPPGSMHQRRSLRTPGRAGTAATVPSCQCVTNKASASGYQSATSISPGRSLG